MALITWDEIDGVPVHYARDLVPSLRNPGTRRTFRSTASFKSKLDATFAELWSHCGLGTASIIVTAGAFVDKPGMHGVGRAFDLDGIIWHATDGHAERQFYCIDFDADGSFYWGVGGILNRHLRYVLHAAYDAAHRDHFHVSDRHPPRFSAGSSSAVTFLQAAITHVHGVPIAIDGDKGPQTDRALGTVFERLELEGPLEDPEVWAEFNLATARLGMGATSPTTEEDDPDDGPAPRREDVPPTGDHERPLDSGTSASFRLRLTTPRMRGAKVEELQRALAAAGHDPGPVDGIFGSLTARAVTAFQRRHGLDVDAIVGPVTAGRLDGFELRDAGVGTTVRPLGPMTDWPTVPLDARRVRAMQILTDRYGYPVNGAAGIVGNLEAESAIIPNRVQGSTTRKPMTSANNAGDQVAWSAEQIMNRVGGETGPELGGIGLAQWTFESRRVGLFRHRFDGDVLGPAILFDLDAQIDYLVHELGSPEFAAVDEVVRDPGVTTESASDVVLTRYEMPADMGPEQHAKRRRMATRARDSFLAANG